MKALGVKRKRYNFCFRSRKALQGDMSGRAEASAAEMGDKQEALRWLVVGMVKAA